MTSSPHQLFNESGISIPFSQSNLSDIISRIQKEESCTFPFVEVVFVNETRIQQLNRKYLEHDYITDIITFSYHDDPAKPEGTLFCCAGQIRRQSGDYDTDFETETLRIVIHGLLHLVGYDDRTDEQQRQMRRLENKYIRLFKTKPNET